MVARLGGDLIVGTAVFLAIFGMLLVRHSVTLAVLENHNDIAGFIYAAFGVVYAVLLAFVVIAVWEKNEATVVTVEQEANEPVDLFRDAQAFPGISVFACKRKSALTPNSSWSKSGVPWLGERRARRLGRLLISFGKPICKSSRKQPMKTPGSPSP